MASTECIHTTRSEDEIRTIKALHSFGYPSPDPRFTFVLDGVFPTEPPEYVRLPSGDIDPPPDSKVSIFHKTLEHDLGVCCVSANKSERKFSHLRVMPCRTGQRSWMVSMSRPQAHLIPDPGQKRVKAAGEFVEEFQAFISNHLTLQRLESRINRSRTERLVSFQEVELREAHNQINEKLQWMFHNPEEKVCCSSSHPLPPQILQSVVLNQDQDILTQQLSDPADSPVPNIPVTLPTATIGQQPALSNPLGITFVTPVIGSTSALNSTLEQEETHHNHPPSSPDSLIGADDFKGVTIPSHARNLPDLHEVGSNPTLLSKPMSPSKTAHSRATDGPPITVPRKRSLAEVVSISSDDEQRPSNRSKRSSYSTTDQDFHPKISTDLQTKLTDASRFIVTDQDSTNAAAPYSADYGRRHSSRDQGTGKYVKSAGNTTSSMPFSSRPPTTNPINPTASTQPHTNDITTPTRTITTATRKTLIVKLPVYMNPTARTKELGKDDAKEVDRDIRKTPPRASDSRRDSSRRSIAKAWGQEVLQVFPTSWTQNTYDAIRQLASKQKNLDVAVRWANEALRDRLDNPRRGVSNRIAFKVGDFKNAAEGLITRCQPITADWMRKHELGKDEFGFLKPLAELGQRHSPTSAAHSRRPSSESSFEDWLERQTRTKGRRGGDGDDEVKSTKQQQQQQRSRPAPKARQSEPLPQFGFGRRRAAWVESEEEVDSDADSDSDSELVSW